MVANKQFDLLQNLWLGPSSIIIPHSNWLSDLIYFAELDFLAHIAFSLIPPLILLPGLIDIEKSRLEFRWGVHYAIYRLPATRNEKEC